MNHIAVMAKKDWRMALRFCTTKGLIHMGNPRWFLATCGQFMPQRHIQVRECLDHPAHYPAGPCPGTECRYPICLTQPTNSL